MRILCFVLLVLGTTASLTPSWAAEEPFTLECQGKTVSETIGSPQTEESDFSGSLTVDLGAMKWAWTAEIAKVYEIAGANRREITLVRFDNPNSRYKVHEHLERETLTYVRRSYFHRYTGRTRARCRRVKLVPLP